MNKWFNESQPKLEDFQVARLARALNMDFETLAMRLGSDLAIDGGSEMPSVVSVPVLGRVSASKVRGGPEAGLMEEVRFDSTNFILVVDGDCMEPDFRAGQLVVFDGGAVEREGFLVGRDYALQLAGDDGRTTFKRLAAVSPDTMTFVCVNRRAYRDPVAIRRTDIVRAGKAKFIVSDAPKAS